MARKSAKPTSVGKTAGSESGSTGTASSQLEAGDFGTVIRRSRIVLCCGTGGVGKTTTAASLALAGAVKKDAALTSVGS